ncbi:brachyurin-like isoform X2 [Agrilus planipennis]|uniref:Brachyurin-like isoform X2 n=1 Tax=Agrilus planipennis TaxID=224129 RepID=A0A7F5RKX9_AGRPL|nr:brachyurin-like isoform X2 [Agrilus planipennis]
MEKIVLIFITFSLVTAYVTRDLSEIPTELRQLPLSDDVRIVGGNEAAPNSLPYQVALNLIFESGRSFCGGSLITRRYVLTAAHCLDDGVISLEVLLGTHNIRRNETTQQSISTSNFTLHEEYKNNRMKYDIATVYLPTPAILNQYVQLIALPSRADASNSFVGSEAIASGWGYDSNNATAISDVLRYVNVSIIADDVCNVTFGEYITDSIICSGGTGRKGICYGDSGGPLVVNGKLVGISKFIGYESCEAGDPSGFTRVTTFLDWIAAHSDAVIS